LFHPQKITKYLNFFPKTLDIIIAPQKLKWMVIAYHTTKFRGVSNVR